MSEKAINVDPKLITLDERTTQVSSLPFPILSGSHFHIQGNGTKQYTHSLFTFPAKFHAPVVQWALSNFAKTNSLILDPFNGSGTVQVEAVVKGVDSIGLDVDPVATFIATAKTTPLEPNRLRNIHIEIMRLLERFRRSEDDYEARKYPATDISLQEYEAESLDTWIPNIPNIHHWFRRYVLVDLARICSTVKSHPMSLQERNYFLSIFAAIVRRCSNADPVPVSGIEYTKYMQGRDAVGRVINPFAFFEQKATKEIEGMGQLWEATRSHPDKRAVVRPGNVHELLPVLPEILRDSFGNSRTIDIVITSPPYCNAVDYHTRHKLEAYWLGLVSNQEEYLEFYPKYVGRRRVGPRIETITFGLSALDEILKNVREINEKQSHALVTYFLDMQEVIKQIHHVLADGGVFLLYIGDSQSAGLTIHTHEFVKAFASQHFNLVTEFSYNVPNRFMSYERHNGANIKAEWCMVFKKATI